MERNNVMDLEWDILLIIDACRYDSFEEKNDIPGKLDHINSVGSSTGEWVKKTFTKKYPELLYISGNPHISYSMTPEICGFQPFKTIVECFDDDWDEKIGTVFPDKINRAFKETWDGERCIIHYLQPHHPFIGEKKIKEVKGAGQWKYGKVRASLSRRIAPNVPSSVARVMGLWHTVWDKVTSGEISADEAKEAYLSNLEFVLKSLKKLLKYPKLKGKKIIITSDHGNCIGEHGIYGHPGGKEHEELIKVPWFEVKI